MIGDKAPEVSRPDYRLFAPVKVLLCGAATVVAGWLFGLAFTDTLLPLRVLLLTAGLATTGAGLVAYFPSIRWDSAELRFGSALLLLIAAAACGLAHASLLTHADSVALVLRNAGLVAVVGAVLVALPTLPRRLLLSAILLFHLGVIVVATSVVPVTGNAKPFTSRQPEVVSGGAPWLGVQLWARLGRQYLQFLQMNNAYHFYAPEPGPTSLVWFRVTFADGATRWVKVPDHPSIRNELERRRYGALATALTMSMPTQMTPERAKAREDAATRYDPPLHPIPETPLAAQYREPVPQAKLLVAAFARYIARTTPHPAGADAPVRSMRVYKIDYHNPPVRAFEYQVDALDPILYEPTYYGEYNPKGELAEASREDLLYWMLPMLRIPPEDEKHKPDHLIMGKGKLINGLRIHAGEREEETMP